MSLTKKDQININLLRVALGIQGGDNLMPSDKDWRDFFLFCKDQAMLGIGFSAVEKIRDCPKDFMLKWYSFVVQIEKRNKHLNEVATDMCQKIAYMGLRCCLLKGQGVAALYPNASRRSSGDIDLWTEGSREKIIEIVHNVHNEPEVSLHHASVNYKDVEIEYHFTPSYLINPIADRRLRQYYHDNQERQFSHLIRLEGCKQDIAFPTSDFNLVFMLSHAYRHFIYEGLGMRHVIDYWMVLKAWNEAGRQKEKDVIRIISKCGMMKFLYAMMWVIGKLMVDDERITKKYCSWMLCDPNEKEGRFLLGHIMRNGNFGRGNQSRQAINDIRNPLKRYVLQKKHSLSIYKHYPSELFWGLYHSIYYRIALKRTGDKKDR